MKLSYCQLAFCHTEGTNLGIFRQAQSNLCKHVFLEQLKLRINIQRYWAWHSGGKGFKINSLSAIYVQPKSPLEMGQLPLYFYQQRCSPTNLNPYFSCIVIRFNIHLTSAVTMV